ncbi:MAG: NAD(P)/FAD-dependent oxidoreductase [Vagococcus sp.]|uniref:NAD(P)/FAD-dependent oxidoreductase n=1 Tax=Vagococcus sp. TaxID=1933889 RepID=UPI002FCBB3DA
MEEVIIVGGGPAGLYSAFYCGLRGMSVKLIEAKPYLGGKLNVYKEKNIWDIGGVTPQPAENIVASLIQQADAFEPTYVLGKKVVNITKEKNQFCVQTEDGEQHFSKSVILGTGTGIITPKKLEFDYLESFEKSNLHYEVGSIESFRQKKVMITGGNDSAIQWAKALAEVAEKVYLVYRKDLFRGYETEVESVLSHEKITCLMEKKITDFTSRDNSRIDSVKVSHVVSEIAEDIDVDEVLVCHGFERNNPLINNVSEFELIDELFFKTTTVGETSVDGVFAAGDAASYDGKVRLIAGAFHDAVNASNHAKKKIDPEATDGGMVSSHHDELQSRKVTVQS